MKIVVMQSTPFDELNFSDKLVPSAALWAGWNDNAAGWGIRLGRVEKLLHAMNPAYGVLHVTKGDAAKTVGKPVREANYLLATKIWTETQAQLQAFDLMEARSSGLMPADAVRVQLRRPRSPKKRKGGKRT